MLEYISNGLSLMVNALFQYLNLQWIENEMIIK